MNSVEELVNMIKERQIKKEAVLICFLKRIKTHDKAVKAFISINKERAIPQKTGKLMSIPFALKDNIMALNTRTTAASKALWNYRSTYDASVVRHLLEAGACLVGKTNMDEFAMGSTTENSAFFPTRNPWDLSKTPGGSSGGSAAAVAAGMAAFDIGSDTGGSIRLPASYCGIVGLKPTYGLVSRHGLIPFASSMDQIGPITRSVRDAALILNIISKDCQYDSTKVKNDHDFLESIEEDVKGYSIACINETLNHTCDLKVKKRFLETIECLRWQGVQIDFISLKDMVQAHEIYTIISSVEAFSNLARYDGIRYGLKVHSDDWKQSVLHSRNKGFGKEVKRRIALGAFWLSKKNYELHYKKAVQIREAMKNKLTDIFERYDAIMTPVSGRLPGKIGEAKVIGRMAEYDTNTVLSNLTGTPAISVPMGNIKNTPVGLQIMSKKFDEAKLLRIARAFEKTAGFYEDGFYPAPHLENTNYV